jgi:hypothetical protein
MFVVAIHEISDPERFWSNPPDLPAGLSLHSTYPRDDGSKAVCLWEADSVDAVREFVDGVTGEVAKNEFFEVDSQHPGTQGLPAGAASQA